MADYATVAQVLGDTDLEGYAAKLSSPAESALVEDEITRASRIIDAYVTAGRETDYFGASPAERTTRIFRGDNSDFLRVSRRVTGSINSATAQPENTNIVFAERFDGIVRVDAEGFTDNVNRILAQPTAASVRVRSDLDAPSVGYYSNPYGYRSTDRQKAFLAGKAYRVSARFGFAATPDDINAACLQLTVRILRGRDEAFSGVIGSINRDGTLIDRGMPPLVKQILDIYKSDYEKTRVDWEAVV